MIKKQNLWLLTLFSVILVLGVYYITMPNSSSILKEEESKEVETNKTSLEIEEDTYITALKEEYEEETLKQIKELESLLNEKLTSTDEKNNAYLKIKALNDKKAEEEALMANIKKEFSYDTFVKIENNDITVVVKTDKHDKTLANNIMRFIQKEYEYHKNKMNYSSDLDKVITNALNDLINEYKNGAVMFNKEKNTEYLKLYLNLKSEENVH